MLSRLAPALVMLGCSGAAFSQCTLLVQDTFRLGDRAHGGNGRPRTIIIGESLNGYWPMAPAEVQWRTVNAADQPEWIWSATSVDPMEVDPLDPSNGTAFTGAGDDAAILPFQALASHAFTMSVDVALGLSGDAPFFAGFTSSSAVNNNFMTGGSLWMWVNAENQWRIYSNGDSTLVASGDYQLGQLNSGWTRLEITFDPATSTTWGHIGATPFGPVPVTLSAPISFIGFESHGNFFNAVNNVLVRTGGSVDVTVSGSGPGCTGSTIVLDATTNAQGAVSVAWVRDGSMVVDGDWIDGSVVSGASTTHLRITGASPGVGGSYACVVSNACGTFQSAPVAVHPCRADFNCDGAVSSQDFFDFLTAFFSVAPSADFNHDAAVNSQDFFDFLGAFFGGC